MIRIIHPHLLEYKEPEFIRRCAGRACRCPLTPASPGNFARISSSSSHDCARERRALTTRRLLIYLRIVFAQSARFEISECPSLGLSPRSSVVFDRSSTYLQFSWGAPRQTVGRLSHRTIGRSPHLNQLHLNHAHPFQPVRNANRELFVCFLIPYEFIFVVNCVLPSPPSTD